MLGKGVKGPVLRGFHVAADAGRRQLSGDHRGALRRLGRLDGWAESVDAPRLRYEVARIRARAHRELGNHADSRHHAGIAHGLAVDHGWDGRARWIRTEFDHEPAAHRSVTGRRSDGTDHTRGASAGSVVNLHARRLRAVHQVSLASATVLEPAALARVALDEIVRIFAAERAFLFLRDTTRPDGETVPHLVPYLGRDHDGADIQELTGYGSTLVSRVADTGDALIVTGSEEGAALGSQSTLVHGLRSIMVAPLTFKNQVRGVVYLDSRVAKGIFTSDDVDILTAITNQVALALETARAAQLDLAVHAAQQQRDLAERLRQAMADLTGTLDPDEVAARLIAAVAGLLPVSAAALLRRSDTDPALSISATHGPVDTAELTAGDGLAGLVDAGPRRGTDPLSGLPGGAWLAVPLQSRGRDLGLLLLANDDGRPYTDAEAEIAAAMAGQGTVALDNATLFAQVHRQAERDTLTGLYNRRRFGELAAGFLRPDRTAAAVMVDIDHFKAVNDTYGHHVGDQVIHEVASRLSANLRGDDVICRYGGEEFAVLLPDTTTDLANQVAARLHDAVVRSSVHTDAGDLTVTVSVGVARPQPGELQTLLTTADGALYEAKRAGRNRVVTA
jgi:diguanylate cyclase (GGDEF)-like protein